MLIHYLFTQNTNIFYQLANVHSVDKYFNGALNI